MSSDGRFVPDQGWAWAVLFGGFLNAVIYYGTFFSCGVFLPEWVESFHADVPSVAWIGSIYTTTVTAAGPLASFLEVRFGCRAVAMTGAMISAVSLLLSTFVTSVGLAVLTFGLLAGTGAGLIHHCSYVSVGRYFEKRRALANGIQSCGCGVGMFIYGPLTQFLVTRYGWPGTMMILAGISFNMLITSALFRAIPPPPKSQKQNGVVVENDVGDKPEAGDRKKKPFLQSAKPLRHPVVIVFFIGGFLYSLGLMSPFIFLPRFAVLQGSTETQAAFLLSFVGAGTVIGMLLFGWMADQRWADAVVISGAVLLAAGAVNVAIPFVTQYAVIALQSALYGVFYGGIVALIAVSLIELLGMELMSASFGAFNFMRSLAGAVGIPLAGWMYAKSGTFVTPFLFIGACFLLAGALCLSLRLATNRKQNKEITKVTTTCSLPGTDWEHEIDMFASP